MYIISSLSELDGVVLSYMIFYTAKIYFTFCVGLRQYSPHGWANLAFLIFPHTASMVGSMEQRMVGSPQSGHRLYRLSESFLGWARIQKEASCRFNPTRLSLFPKSLTFSWFMCSCASWRETALPECSSLCSSHKRTPADL